MHLKSVLPEEILLEIFSEIDKNELRKFLEISSEWRDLLIRNAKVMRKLPLILMSNTWREKMEFVKNYGKFIREVEFNGTKIESFNEVYEVLELIPNIEKLTILNIEMKEKNLDENSEESSEESSEENSHKKLIFKRLNEIVLDDGDNDECLKFIATHLEVKITSLKCRLTTNAQLPILEQILVSSSDLKSLEIASELDAVFPLSDDAAIKFQLDKLIIKSSLLKFNEQLAKFLASQQTLKEVGFISTHVDYRYHNTIFRILPEKRKLHLNIDNFATNDCLNKLKRTPANLSLHTLSISGRNQHINVFEELLRMFPKLRSLNIENLTQFYSDKIQKLPLTQLSIDCVKCECLKTEKLKSNTKIQLKDIIQSHPKETYERNLQNFCDLMRFSDKKPKDIIEAF